MDELRARVLELLDYDPATGLFTWKIRRGCRPAGAEAGTLSYGYIRIKVDGKCYRAHRLAWLVVNGHLPDELDHINLIKDDNRISNLRPATSQENSRNTGRRSSNTSGFKGVCWHSRDKKWHARAQDVNGKRKFLGSFPTPEAASAAYESYASRHYGEFYYEKSA